MLTEVYRGISDFLGLFPTQVAEAATRYYAAGTLEEVRLRAFLPASLTVGGQNLILPYVGDREVVQETLNAFCGGSLYTYEDTVREGYLPLSCGCRLGVAGVLEGRGVRLANALVLRIPRQVTGCAAPLVEAWREAGCHGGALVIAPPAGGKTTILKDFIASVSRGSGARRVAVVDSRMELCPRPLGALVDVLTGYPRERGLRMALATLSPEVIVLDEIGEGDVDAILAVANGGIPLVASLHGTGIETLKRRGWLSPLLSAGVFCHIGVVTRREGRFCLEVMGL